MTRESMQFLVIFDGECSFCTKSVQFILRHESEPILRFTPLQSSTGSRLMHEFGLNPQDAESFVLVSGGRVFMKSDAVVELAKYLHGGWRLLAICRIIPRPVRNWAYDVFARNRYRCFGRYDQCMVPSDEIKDRFLC